MNRKLIIVGRVVNNHRNVVAALLFCSFIFLLPQKLNSQVVNNNGAVINIQAGTYVNSQDAFNTAGTLSNAGTLSLTGNFNNTATANGNGIYRIGGNWNNNGGVFGAGNSTVYFLGSANQSVTNPGGETFYNLYLNNSGATGSNLLGLNNNVTVLGTLTLLQGNIYSGGNKILLSNPLPSALSYISTTQSRILGKFERGVNQAGTYLFPLGTSLHYNPANLITNSVSVGGTVLSEFLTPGLIDSTGLPLPDPPDEVARVYQDGYWSMTANGGFSTGNFNINLDATGFTTFAIHDITRIIKRTTGGSWLLDGTHSAAIGNVVYRNNLTGNLSSAGTQFALAQSRPRIITQPRDTAVCETMPYANSWAEFMVVASSTKNLTYTWYKEPAVLLTGPHFNTTGPGTLIILNVTLSDAGKYYCIVTDQYGTSTRSSSATLVVNKRPVASATPSIQGNACSNVAITSIVLNETNGVIGTSFVWTRNNPSGIVSAIPLSGTIPAVGGSISGTFLNTNDSPVTVTFTIRPIGPGTTSCGGDTIHATVTVNPVPKANKITNTRPQICYGGTTAITLDSYTTLTTGYVTFDYNVSVTDGTVVGPTAPGTNLPKGSNLNLGPYQDNSDTIKSVTYYVTPRAVALGCPDGAVTPVEVKIHAKPLQGITVIKPLTCDAGHDAIIRADLSKGAGPYRIKWTGPNGFKDTLNTTISNLYSGRYTATVTDNLGCSNNSFRDLNGSKTTSVMVVDPQVSCNGGSDGVLGVSVDFSTGIGPWDYWILKNNVDTVVHGVLNSIGPYNYHGGISAGAYYIRMRDSQGCYEKLQNGLPPYIDMPEPDPIKVTFVKKAFPGGYNISCKGYNDGKVKASATIGGNGGYTYHWYTVTGSIPGPVNTDSIYNVTAGRYYLEVRDIKNCYMLDSVDLTDPPGILLSGYQLSLSRDGNYNISCSGGNDGFIKMTISGGSGSYVFNWSGPGGFTASTRDISGLKAGTYTATVTDVANSSCLVMPKPSFTLTEPAALNISVSKSVSTDGAYNINCNGGTGMINLTVTGGSTGNYRYAWSTTDGSGIVAGQEDQNALKAGNYHVVVTDSNLCVTSTDVTLTQPLPLSVSLQPVDLTCISQGSINLTVTGGVGPYTYLWSNGAVTQNISGLSAGTYSVMVTDVNGCIAPGSAAVSLPPPVVFTGTLSDHNGFGVSCYGLSDGSIKLNITSGVAPYTFQWTTPYGNLSTQDISSLKAGHYDVLVTDKNSCTATSGFDLTEPGKMGMNLTLSQSSDGMYNINCAGGSTGSISVDPVNNAGSVSYLWSDGSLERNRTYIPAGTYKVILLDQNNCNADTTVILTQPDSIRISFDVVQALCPDSPDGQITASATGGIAGGGYTYRWSNNYTGQFVNNILRGWWRVTVTDANNCAMKDSVKMEPQRSTCLVIPNIFSPNGDNINDTWIIEETNLYPELEVRIFNRWGELVWKSARGYPNPWDGKSNGIPLPIDSYFYLIDLHNGTKPVTGNVTIVK
ncbi:MAG TPA: gliding motility-associated C-terminal domain-containing protein [Bacteroidales bacterium]|nr:gliding motility-associated C-terminal domain-containing protein [Bacteroidales bacterium]